MKNQIIKKNLYLKNLNEVNFPQNFFINNKENMITILKDSKTTSNNLKNNNEPLTAVNKNKYNSLNNLQSKSFKYNRTSYDNNSVFKKNNFDKNIILNKTINNITKEKEILPYINNIKMDDFRNSQNFLKSKYLGYINKYRENKLNTKNSNRLTNVKTIFNNNENNKNDILSKTNKNINEHNIYKYSILLKNLDIWDKEHCNENKIKRKMDLFSLLYDYFEKEKMKNKKNDLIYASKILTARDENNYDDLDYRKHNKFRL